MICAVATLITVIVSWPLLATNTRLPSGEATTFHGSAPVTSSFSNVAENVPLVLTLITVTLLPAALAM